MLQPAGNRSVSRAPTGTVPDAIARLGNNVVKVKSAAGFRGTGCYLGNRLVLTASHVFSGRDVDVGVILRSGEILPARIISRDRDLDSAVLELDSEPPVSLPTVAIAETVSIGDRCYRVGYGMNDKPSWSGGTVTGFRDGPAGKACWVHTTSQGRGGDSGGPVFLADGRLIGNLWGGPEHPERQRFSVVVACLPLRKFLGPLLGRLRCDPPSPPEPPLPPLPIPPNPGPSGIDYDVLAAKIVELMATDPRFRGPPGQDGTPGIGLVGTIGEPGPPGPRGSQGPPGAAGSLSNLQELADKLAPLLPPMGFQAVNSKGESVGEAIEKRLGETLKLRSFLTEKPK